MGTHKRATVRQSDIRRMMRVVQSEGFSPRSVRMEADGAVLVDITDEIEPPADPLDFWRHQRGSSSQRH